MYRLLPSTHSIKVKVVIVKLLQLRSIEGFCRSYDTIITLFVQVATYEMRKFVILGQLELALLFIGAFHSKLTNPCDSDRSTQGRCSPMFIPMVPSLLLKEKKFTTCGRTFYLHARIALSAESSSNKNDSACNPTNVWAEGEGVYESRYVLSD